MWSIKYRREAIAELKAAVAWYAERDARVTDRWLDDFELTLESIRVDPDSHAVIGNHLRYRQLSSFPYIVVFRTTPHHVVVVAITHTSRDSDVWQSRIE